MRKKNAIFTILVSNILNSNPKSIRYYCIGTKYPNYLYCIKSPLIDFICGNKIFSLNL